MQKFALKVYKIVKKIPKGKTLSYKQVAIKLGNKNLARAVGNTLHKNPDPKNIPCHRVIKSNGKLASGYAFGGKKIQRQKLIEEGVRPEDLRL